MIEDAGGDAEQLFATPRERYDHLIRKETLGEVLTEEERQFMAWYRQEYDWIFSQESRGKLAVVE